MMNIKLMLLYLFTFLIAANTFAQKNIDPRVREYLTPIRIVWQSSVEGSSIEKEGLLLQNQIGQSSLSTNNSCILQSSENGIPSILFDFGKEIQGGVRLVVGELQSEVPVKVRLRFGESVSEAMSDVGGDKGATNDHAMRDYELDIARYGKVESGGTGFRFLRIDLVTPNTTLHLSEANAVSIYRDIPYRGSFKSSDERLNRIWMTGAYTVHLNMQEYLWDGIKRDRLVWVGDLHPEVMTVNSVFGYNEVVPKSLDLARDTTPLPGWMTGISAYSLWWIICHYDWYRYHGDLEYLKEQTPYLTELLNLFLSKVSPSGKEELDGWRFLDWPSSNNKEGVDAGLHALLLRGLESGAYLCDVLGDNNLAKKCRTKAGSMKKLKISYPDNSKQAAALLSISNLVDAKQINKEVITKDGVKNFSTFYGYYMLQAMAKAEDYTTAMEYIKTYWGGMLDMGATSFWEDFDIEWLENAAPIDELVPEGKKDIHGDYGDHCYVGLRHSLCHGWASGPTAWLTEHVLGVQIVEPGCKVLKIEPHLGNLDWVEGTFPTPKGDVYIKHTKVNGKIETEIKAPEGIKIK